MGKLFPWLLLAVVPLVKKVLIALGIGWISYQGVSAALDYVKDNVVAQWGALPADIANFLSFAGFGQAIGIVLGGIAARGALMLVQRLGKVAA